MSSEVAVFVEPNDQFSNGATSAYECVAWGCATLDYCGPPGGVPSGSESQIAATANEWYATETGNPQSTGGLSVPQEYAILHGLGLAYVGLPISASSQHAADIANVKDWLGKGIPVLICGAETGFYDVGLGDIVPYGWTPSGSHCIVASGIAPSGNLYVRDYANVGHGLVPGSRREYDINKMFLISGTAVYPRWWKGSAMSTSIPAGWKDDGKTLTAPNGIAVVSGFRDYILSHNWDAGDLPVAVEAARSPLEISDPALGSGTFQCFYWIMLEWTQARGVFVAYVGKELAATRALLMTLGAQVAQLETELATLKAAPVVPPLSPGSSEALGAALIAALKAALAASP